MKENTMTKRQVHQTSKRAIRAALKFRAAADNAAAAYSAYWPDHRPMANCVRDIAELSATLASHLLIESGDDLLKNVPK